MTNEIIKIATNDVTVDTANISLETVTAIYNSAVENRDYALQEACVDAAINIAAAQKVNAISKSGEPTLVIETTFKNNRCSVTLDGAKVSLDKATQIVFESELVKRGANVILKNENGDICPLDEDIFTLGKHHAKIAIRQFARGEKVTGAKVLNGKFYPVVKANAKPATEDEPVIVETVNVEEQSTNTESANENSENNAELVNQLKTFNAKFRSLSCEEFLAENAGLPIAEYREQKAAAKTGIAKLEIEFKIEDIKSEIRRLESENYYTARNLYGIVVLEKHYATDESLQAYAAELVDEFNDRLGKINEAQAELATLAPATAETATVEEPAREKFLKAKEQIKAAPDRLLDNGNFTTKWLVRDEHGNWNRTNKGNAANILNTFGLDIFTYLDEHEKWVVENVAISARNAAAEDFALRIVAPAKMLALPAPAPVAEPAVEEPDGYNPDVFSLLPKREDLNDVDGEFDEDAAEYTDRNDRYNRGEKIAADLTAKLRTVDPTVEVTFAIDDDEDTYYLSYAGIIRTPFTATGVEASFHAMKQREAKPEEPAEPVKYVATQITYPNGHEGEPTREVSKTFDNLDDAARFIADDNPFIETETGYHTFAYDEYYFGGVYWAGYRIATTDGKILVEADTYEVKGDESIDRLVIKYINDNDNTTPATPANNPLACLNNLGYEDDVIEPAQPTVDEPVTIPEFATTIAQLKNAYDSAVSVWEAVDYDARTNKRLRPVVETARATVTAAETALQAFGDAQLAQLRPLLDQTIRGATIRIINEDGIDWGSQKLADISLKFRRTGPDFAIIANDNYYATCATPDAVRRVIERLKQAIACGAAEFSFAPQDFTPAQVEALVYYTVTDSRGDKTNWSKYKTFATTVAAVEWIFSFTADNPDFAVCAAEITDRRNGLTRYTLTAADITALYPPEPAPDTVAAVARICATVNDAAPAGWEVYYNISTELFQIDFNNATVARLTSVEMFDAVDAHPPEEFFDAFPLPAVTFDDDGNILDIWF